MSDYLSYFVDCHPNTTPISYTYHVKRLNINTVDFTLRHYLFIAEMLGVLEFSLLYDADNNALNCTLVRGKVSTE